MNNCTYHFFICQVREQKLSCQGSSLTEDNLKQIRTERQPSSPCNTLWFLSGFTIQQVARQRSYHSHMVVFRSAVVSSILTATTSSLISKINVIFLGRSTESELFFFSPMLSPHSNLLEQRFICRFLSFLCVMLFTYLFLVSLSRHSPSLSLTPLYDDHVGIPTCIQNHCPARTNETHTHMPPTKRTTVTHRTHELTLHSWSTMRSQQEGDRKQSTSPRGDEGRGEGTWATKTHPFEGRVSAGLNERAPATVVSLVVGWTGLPGATFPRPHHVNWTA